MQRKREPPSFNLKRGVPNEELKNEYKTVESSEDKNTFMKDSNKLNDIDEVNSSYETDKKIGEILNPITIDELEENQGEDYKYEGEMFNGIREGFGKFFLNDRNLLFCEWR